MGSSLPPALFGVPTVQGRGEEEEGEKRDEQG